MDELCVNAEKFQELQHKIELIQQLAIGKTAPEFVAEDIDGNLIKLSEIQAQKTLLFFWASWCPHCKEMIADINDIYSMGAEEHPCNRNIYRHKFNRISKSNFRI